MVEKLVAKVHRRQAVRHVVANKLQLALTVLRELEEGRLVPRRLVERAVRDMEAVIGFIDQTRRNRPRIG